jgi:hypothetical protein
MLNNYLLSYDFTMTDPTPQRLLEFVKSNSLTFQFLVPYPGAVFIKSSADLRSIVASYQPFLEPNFFTLTRVEPSLVNGLMTVDYWQWLNTPAPPPVFTPLIENR